MAVDTETVPVEVGRSDLKIPVIEWETRTDYRYFTQNVLSFFRELWKANGLPPNTTDVYRRPEYDKPYNNQLVIPAEADKPLIVIEGSYTPRDGKEIERERIINDHRSMGHHRDGGWRSDPDPVVVGYERHGIYTPPESLGRMVPLLTVSSDFGRHQPPIVNGPSDRIYPPSFVSPSPDKSFEDAQREQATAFNDMLRTVLDETIEYLR